MKTIKDTINYSSLNEMNLLMSVALTAAEDLNSFENKIKNGKVPSFDEEIESYYSILFSQSTLGELLNTVDLESLLIAKYNKILDKITPKVMDKIITRNADQLRILYSEQQKRVLEKRAQKISEEIYKCREEISYLKDDNNTFEEKIEYKKNLLAELGKCRKLQDQNVEVGKGNGSKIKNLTDTELDLNLQYCNTNFAKIYSSHMDAGQKRKWQKLKSAVKEKVEEKYEFACELRD